MSKNELARMWDSTPVESYRQKVQDIEDVISETVKSIKNKTYKLIKTGYPGIDKFSGGLTRGEII